MHSLPLWVLLLTTLVAAGPIGQNPAQKTCQDYSLPLTVTTMNYKWELEPITTNEQQAAYLAQVGRRDSAEMFRPISAPNGSETATYTISGTFCSPSQGGNGTVLLATHGGGYDRSYWHPSYEPGNYSFVDFAIGQGYSVFYYDRLGLGKSQSMSGYTTQASIHTALIQEISKLLRSDKFGAPASKIALVGHSMGSVYSNAALNSGPELVDAAILTGIAYNITTKGVADQAKQSRLANLDKSNKWSTLDGGWTVWVDIYSNIESFFKAPFYDREAVQWTEDNKQPAAVLENLTIQRVNLSAPVFAGPVLVTSGEFDFIACGGNCVNVLDQKVADTFPASKNLVTHVQPNSGHAINFALNATVAFGIWTDFLKANGI